MSETEPVEETGAPPAPKKKPDGRGMSGWCMSVQARRVVEDGVVRWEAGDGGYDCEHCAYALCSCVCHARAA